MSNYNPIDSLGIYSNDDKTQVIGYWKVPGSRRINKDHFVSLCTLPINSPFQNVILEAVKHKMQKLIWLSQ